MKIDLKKITVRELAKGYVDNAEEGVRGYGGKLDIRPPYQREFIYKDKQRNAVIDSINNNFPLNVMYWSVRDDGTFEVIDGQQRTISICQYIKGDFSINERYFHNLEKDEQDKIFDYELMIYLCSGTDSEKLNWFKIVNIAGERLLDQELRNAVYSGSWVSDAKKHFSKKGCPAQGISGDYVSGPANRQHYLEKAIKWISNDNIENHMAKNQHKQNANELWIYYQSVIDWVKLNFKYKTKFMKNVDWGILYNEYKDKPLDTDDIDSEVRELMLDNDVTNRSGIYPYILTRDEKYLSIRAFEDGTKQKVFEKQKGVCVKCNKRFELSKMEADHITPWHEGGKTIEENCQVLCKGCNRRKSGK